MKIFLVAGFLMALFLPSVLISQAADSPPRIEMEEVKARMESGQEIVFIDTRNGSAWSNSNKIIPGAIRVRGGQELTDVMKTLPKETFIVIYCT